MPRFKYKYSLAYLQLRLTSAFSDADRLIKYAKDYLAVKITINY
jgi:hypothetical protein